MSEKTCIFKWLSIILGNKAEDCMEAAKEAGVMVKGVYKNFLDEPVALVKKLGNSFGELIKDPSLISDPKWIEKSQMLSLGNIGGTAMLAAGLATGNKDFARLGRNIQSISVDATKTTSNNIERSASALGFGSEMGLDTINAKFANGDSTRLSSGVALSGQVARTLGVVYKTLNSMIVYRRFIQILWALFRKQFLRFLSMVTQQVSLLERRKI